MRYRIVDRGPRYGFEVQKTQFNTHYDAKRVTNLKDVK